MVTQELLTYIRSALAGGQTQEIITQTLISQGWSVADIQEGFNAVMPISTPTNTQPVNPNSVANPQGVIEPKKGWGIGRIILWIIVIGIIISLLSGLILGYRVYRAYKTFKSQNTLVSNLSLSNVKSFFDSFGQPSNSSTNNNENNNNTKIVSDSTNSCARNTLKRTIGASIFFNNQNLDPLLCYYSQDADLSDFSKITIDHYNSRVETATDEFEVAETWSSPVSEIFDAKNLTITKIFKHQGPEVIDLKLLARGSTSSDALVESKSVFQTGLQVIEILSKGRVASIQICKESIDWNTQGNWFDCNKTSSKSSNDLEKKDTPNMFKVYESDTDLGKALFAEKRQIRQIKDDKSGVIYGYTFFVEATKILRDNILPQYYYSFIVHYKDNDDLMLNKDINEIRAMYANTPQSVNGMQMFIDHKDNTYIYEK